MIKNDNYIIKLKYLIILIIFLSLNNFFLNSYIILKNKYQSRMIHYGGYCEKQGYGFTKYINEKYSSTINANIKSITVLRVIQFPPPHGHFFNYKKEFSKKHLILLNPKEKDLKSIYYDKGYKVLEKKDNCYFAVKE